MIPRFIVDRWMSELGEMMETKHYDPSLIFNFDETFLFPGMKKVKIISPLECARPAIAQINRERRTYHAGTYHMWGWPISSLPY